MELLAQDGDNRNWVGDGGCVANFWLGKVCVHLTISTLDRTLTFLILLFDLILLIKMVNTSIANFHFISVLHG